MLGRLRGLPDPGLVDALVEAEADVRRAQARKAAAVAVIGERIAASGHRVDATADQVAVCLAVSARSADHLLEDAAGLMNRPQVWDALFEGVIDLPKARLIIDLLDRFAGLPRAALEADAIGYAGSHTAHQLRKHLQRLTCDGDPDEKLRDRAVDARGVWLYPAGHGMVDLAARLSAEHAEILFQRLTQLAQADTCPDPYGQGQARSLAQRRADALAGFLHDTTQVKVQVDVTISADTLIGDDHRDALLGKHGPVPAALARHLAWSPDARWRRLVCDPLTGALTDCNAKTYKIPDRVKRAVRLRDRTCRFPGCTRPAEYTDTDHIVAWAAGGKTNAVDLAGLCRRPHLVKTHSAWKVRHRPDLTSHELTWTGPLDTRHTTKAHNYHPRT